MTITAIDNFENILINIRKTIIKVLNINPTRVMNAASVRGTDLSKIISASESTSLTLNDVFIIFEFKESDDDIYWLMHENDNTSSYITSYDFNLKIYGKGSHIASNLIINGFKNINILTDLYDLGIKVEGITKPITMHEPINETIWPRTDFKIVVTSRIENINSDEIAYFTGITNIISQKK